MNYASHWEQHYRDHLIALKRAGEIEYFRYEPVTFVIGDQCTYTPDFIVVPADRTRPIEFHEVKGFQREDAIVKFKVAASNNPHFTFVMIGKDTDGSWKELRRIVSGVKAPAVRKTPTKQTKPKADTTPLMTVRKQIMTYAQMQLDPELKYVLEMKPEQLRDLRADRSVSDMAALVGMTPQQWSNVEAGKSHLYHHRHVSAVNKLRYGV